MIEDILIPSLIVVPSIFGSIAIAVYFGQDGIRAHVRRKSWCRKMGYKLVKRFYGDKPFTYDYMGLDAEGVYHSIPSNIYPDNHVIFFPY